MPSYKDTTIDKRYISSIYFLDQRDILNKVLDVTNEDNSFLDIMDQWRRRVPATSAKFHHYVNQPYYEIKTGPGVDWTAVGVRAGDIVTTTGNQRVYYVQDPTDVTSGTVQIDGTVGALVGTETFVITSNAHGEGSSGPDPVRFGLKKYEAKAQIFKMAYELTDVELGNAIEVEFNGQPFYMYKAQHDALLKYKNDISAQFMFGETVDSSFSGWNDDLQNPPSVAHASELTDADGNRVQLTRGLNSWATEGFDLTGSGSYTNALNGLDEITKEMNVIRCPRSYKLIVGTEANNLMDNDIKALNVNNTSTGVGHRMDVGGRNVDMILDSFTLYGRKWEKMWMPMIDHEIGQAYLGADNSKYAYFCPDTPIKVQGEEGTVDRMRVRYLEGSGMSFGYREIKLGGLAPTPTDSRSVFEVVYESIQGLQICGAEHFGKALFG